MALQIVAADAAAIHPEAQALIADELRHAYGLINGSVLCTIAVQFILEDQQAACPFPFSLLH